mmetsp:Transcript_1268/g.4331  ORF Transcript_1268/g.4331 Transcript_1268/m.4331 type:complete len:1265 (-) Transcript_1268:8775-12569(-)
MYNNFQPARFVHQNQNMPSGQRFDMMPRPAQQVYHPPQNPQQHMRCGQPSKPTPYPFAPPPQQQHPHPQHVQFGKPPPEPMPFPFDPPPQQQSFPQQPPQFGPQHHHLHSQQHNGSHLHQQQHMPHPPPQRHQQDAPPPPLLHFQKRNATQFESESPFASHHHEYSQEHVHSLSQHHNPSSQFRQPPHQPSLPAYPQRHCDHHPHRTFHSEYSHPSQRSQLTSRAQPHSNSPPSKFRSLTAVPHRKNIAPPLPVLQRGESQGSSHVYCDNEFDNNNEQTSSNEEPHEVWEMDYVFNTQNEHSVDSLVSHNTTSHSKLIRPQKLFETSSDSSEESESEVGHSETETKPNLSEEPSPPTPSPANQLNLNVYHLATKCGLIPETHTQLELKYLPEETLYHDQYFRLRDYILGLYWGEDMNETDDEENTTRSGRRKKNSTQKLSEDIDTIPYSGPSKQEMTVGKTHVNYSQRKYVTLQQTMTRLKDEHRTHMQLLYKFLNRFGYINVGVQPPAHIVNQLIKKQEVKSQESFNLDGGERPQLPSTEPLPQSSSGAPNTLPNTPPKRNRVIIIGAGMSGLMAARQLTNFGYEVLLLEGRDRIGGRAHSDDSTGVDFGASIVTGVVGNPATLFSEELQMVRIQGELGGLYDARTGKKVDKTSDQTIETGFNQLLEQSCDYRNQDNGKEEEWRQFMSRVLSSEQLTSVKNASLGKTLAHHIEQYLTEKYGDSPEEHERMRRLMYWHVANLEYGLGTHINNVSLCEWDQDDEYDLPSGHYYYARGYKSLAQKIASDPQVGTNLNIRFNTEVTKIDYSYDLQSAHLGTPPVVRVHTRSNTNTLVNPVQITRTSIDESIDPPPHSEELVFEADKVLVTASLGILKADRLQFNPPLPLWKRQCIDRLGFGLLNKIVLYFKESFWEGQDYLGMVQDMENYGKGYLVWNMEPATGSAVLSCLVAGDAALQHETDIMENPQGIVQFIMQRLRKIYGYRIPDPERIALTRWKTDPYAMGTYSYVACGATGSDYDTMAKSVNDTLFFAGEATCRTHPSTVFGALLSGMREAGKIDASFHPNDLCIPKSERDMKKNRLLRSLAAGTKRKTMHGHKRSVFASRKRRKTEISERDHEQQKKLRAMVRSLPVIPKRRAEAKRMKNEQSLDITTEANSLVPRNNAASDNCDLSHPAPESVRPPFHPRTPPPRVLPPAARAQGQNSNHTSFISNQNKKTQAQKSQCPTSSHYTGHQEAPRHKRPSCCHCRHHTKLDRCTTPRWTVQV